MSHMLQRLLMGCTEFKFEILSSKPPQVDLTRLRWNIENLSCPAQWSENLLQEFNGSL